MADVSTMVTAGVALATAVVVLVDRVLDIRRQAKGHEAQIAALKERLEAQLAAKDERIKALTERLEAQKELTAPRLREHLDATVAIVQKHVDTLMEELEVARGRNAELEGRLREAERSGQDVEIVRQAIDMIRDLGAAARDSYIRARVLLEQPTEEDVERLQARIRDYLAATSSPAAEGDESYSEENLRGGDDRPDHA